MWIAAGVCVTAAVCLFAISALSFETLRGVALSSIPPGYEDRFTPALFAKISFGLRFLGTVLCLCAVAMVVFAERLNRMLHQTARDLGAFGREMRTAARSLRHDPRFRVIALVAVVSWGILLRLAFFAEPIRNDEAYSFMHYASRPIYVGLSYYSANNHLLNTLLMHISTSLFGASVWTVRLPTLIAGILIVPATYAAVRLYHGPGAALLAAALASASSPLIEYSFNARGYSLGTLFFLLMIIMIGLERGGSAGARIILPIAAALALYAVPTMVYGVAGAFLYLLVLEPGRSRTFVSMIWTAILSLALYAPTLATVGLSSITSNQWTAPVPRELLLGAFTQEAASLWRYWNIDLPVLASVVVAVGAIATLLFRKTLRLPPAAILLSVVLAACVLLSIQRVVPPRRSWLFLLPLYFGAAGAGWSMIVRKVRFAEQLMPAVALILAAWMGGTVLSAKSLRHSGIEAAGPRSVEPIVIGAKQYLLQGAQFICSDYFDSGLDFEMRVHRIPYEPTPTGELLIVTPAGASPERTLELAGFLPGEAVSVRKIAHYQDADVYVADRGPTLPFRPRGSSEMGVFTASGDR